MTKSDKHKVLIRLIALKYTPDFLKEDAGICNRFKSRGARIKYVYSFFSSWPMFSGIPLFPVPSKERDVQSAYMRCRCWHGEYGKNRKSLLNYLIKEIKKDIKNT